MNQEWCHRAKEMEHKLKKEFIRQREEEERSHSPYEKELMVLECVRRGNYKALEQPNQYIDRENRVGTMSSNPLRQKIYEFITTATLVTRFAVEGGLDLETAYTLSDLYIQQADALQQPEEIEALRQMMTWDFARRVSQSRSHRQGYSKQVSKTIDYLLNHLHSPITLDALAQNCGISPQYLCTIFERQTGSTIWKFIRRERMEEACMLLGCSEMSGAEICNYVGFGTQSYFIKAFKQEIGITPNQYRKQYFRKQWKKDLVLEEK